MKKSNIAINSIFSVAEEMVPGNGEDSYCYKAKEDSFIIASFDGLGGSGAKKYENYSGKTGAYVASRAVCGGVQAWFENSYKSDELVHYIQLALKICNEYADSKSSRIMGSLSKAFPTTAAIITGEQEKEKLKGSCYWAGDSRCYMLDSNGLHQLTEDDLDGQDAMSNLSNDGVMTNVINASTLFDIHKKSLYIDSPCVLFTATDGCFGYLKSPMEFEHLLVDSLVKAKNLSMWKTELNKRMNSVAGDDYTLTVAICGFDNFENIKKTFVKRNEYLKKEYLKSKKDVNSLWDIYKQEYSRYL